MAISPLYWRARPVRTPCHCQPSNQRKKIQASKQRHMTTTTKSRYEKKGQQPIELGPWWIQDFKLQSHGTRLCPPIRENQKKKKKNSAAEDDLLSGSVSRSTNPSIIHPCLIYLSCWLAFALHRSDANRRLLALCRPERELRACDCDAMRCHRPPWLKKWSGDRCAHMAKDLLFWVGCTCAGFELLLASTRRPPVERIGSGTGTSLQATSHPVQREADSLNKV